MFGTEAILILLVLMCIMLLGIVSHPMDPDSGIAPRRRFKTGIVGLIWVSTETCMNLRYTNN